MSEGELRDYKDHKSNQAGRKSPAQRMLEKYQDDYYTLRQASLIVGIHKETLRRALLDESVEEIWPSKVLIHGKMEIYLLDDDMLVDVGAFYNGLAKVHGHLESKYGSKQKIPKSLSRKILEMSKL